MKTKKIRIASYKEQVLPHPDGPLVAFATGTTDEKPPRQLVAKSIIEQDTPAHRAHGMKSAREMFADFCRQEGIFLGDCQD